MREFDYFECSGPRDCLQCAVIGEYSVLGRELTLLRGNVAKVKFFCSTCGFLMVGVVNVDPQEKTREEQLEEEIEASPLTKRPLTVRASELRAANQALRTHRPQPAPVEEKEYSSDDEALHAVYGGMVSEEELQRALEDAFPDPMEFGTTRAERRITPISRRMGARGNMAGFNVAYYVGEQNIEGQAGRAGGDYMCADGIPLDLDQDAKEAWGTFKNATTRPVETIPIARPPRRPRGAVGIDANPGGFATGVTGGVFEDVEAMNKMGKALGR